MSVGLQISHSTDVISFCVFADIESRKFPHRRWL